MQVSTTLNDQAKTLASSITYLPYGGITGLTYGNSLSLSHGYDNQYRTSTIVVGSVLDRTYAYDANGNMTSLDDGEAAGNEALETAGIYTYDQNTNLLDYILEPLSVGYDYDYNANTVSANYRTFVYDSSNQLIQVLDNSNLIAEYTYNGAGQRIRKWAQSGTRIFHYDFRGHLITETTQSGTMIAEYIYLGDQLLAMITKPQTTENVYYFHNDHLGTPQVLTNDSQNVVWKAVYTPFGRADILTQTVENPFRLPGQYYDAETQLHYNYFRYYNPQTGRYITPDPIGLESGVNLWPYAQGNPLKFIDPYGKIAIADDIAAAALVAGVYAWTVAYVNSPEGQALIKDIARELEWLGEQLKRDAESSSNVCEFGRRVSDKYGPLWKAPGMPGWTNPQSVNPHDPHWWDRPPNWDKMSTWEKVKWWAKKAAGALTGAGGAGI